MRSSTLITLLTLSLGLVLQPACGGEPDSSVDETLPAVGGKADSTQPTVATLSFAADWSESQSGVLTAGGQAAIDYDEARLPNCRASHNGNPGWQITAYLKFLPSGAVSDAELFAHQTKPTGEVDYYTWEKQTPLLSIPAGTESIEVWFKNVSAFDHPCTEWDSDFGRNYHFAVEAGPSATLSFNQDWTIGRKGQLVAGGTLVVSYAPERMQSIAAGSSPYFSFFASKYHCYGYGCCEQEYQQVVHARFASGGAFVAFPIPAGQSSVQIAIPADADQVEIFVDADVYTTTWYCGGAPGPKYRQPTPDHFYDSNYGKNFLFDLD